MANVRSYFNKHGGSLGTQGSLSFLFDHKSVFHVKPAEGADREEFELSLMDFEAELEAEEEEWLIYGAFDQFANLQKFLEDSGCEIVSAEFERIPTDYKEVTPEQREAIEKLLEKFEDDEDVQNVFHNMKEDGPRSRYRCPRISPLGQRWLRLSRRDDLLLHVAARERSQGQGEGEY